MGQVVKHWRSLKEARSELVGWENKWFKWYRPYSGCIMIARYTVIMLIGNLIFLLLKALLV